MVCNNQRRVVITGIGIVSPVGVGVEPFWKNVCAGVSGIDRSPILEKSFCHWKIAAEVKDFHPEQWLGRKDTKRRDRFAQLALASSYLALENSGLNLDKEDRHRVGLGCQGCAFGRKRRAAPCIPAV